MTLKPKLMNAILSMDAYNRGYDAGISTFSDLSGTHIGNAIIKQNSSDALGVGNDSAIGFYALAYDTDGDGEADLVTYRGTDYPESNTFRDVEHGWLLGGGNYNASQGVMAVEFYKEVAEIIDGPQANLQTVDIFLTGHSLGGGLAGYVASLYGKNAEIFDGMSYEDAANATHFYASIDPSDPQYPSIAQPLIDLVYNGNSPWAINSDGVNAQHINGETLSFLDPIAGYFELDTATESSQANHALDGIDLIPDAEENLTRNEPNARHSQAALVILTFADEPEVTESFWQNAVEYFWPVMYDDTFAGDMGYDSNASVAGELQAQDKFASILRTAIAYSAIDEGVRPFGDTAIRALYNDANDLGERILDSDFQHMEPYLEEISETFVHFSGLLALNKVHQADVPGAILTDGVISETNNRVTINFSDAWWSHANSAALPNMFTRNELINSIVAQIGTQQQKNDVQTGTFDTTKYEHVIFLEAGRIEQSQNFTGAFDPLKTTLVIGSVEDETITVNSERRIDFYAGEGTDKVVFTETDPTVTRTDESITVRSDYIEDVRGGRYYDVEQIGLVGLGEYVHIFDMGREYELAPSDNVFMDYSNNTQAMTFYYVSEAYINGGGASETDTFIGGGTPSFIGTDEGDTVIGGLGENRLFWSGAGDDQMTLRENVVSHTLAYTGGTDDIALTANFYPYGPYLNIIMGPDISESDVTMTLLQQDIPTTFEELHFVEYGYWNSGINEVSKENTALPGAHGLYDFVMTEAVFDIDIVVAGKGSIHISGASYSYDNGGDQIFGTGDDSLNSNSIPEFRYWDDFAFAYDESEHPVDAINGYLFTNGISGSVLISELAFPNAAGDSGDNFLRGDSQDNKLSGNGGDDDIQGGSGDDTLIGGTGEDTLRGENGNDALIGGADDDRLYGDSGFDTAVFSGNYADYTLYFGGSFLRVTDQVGTDGEDLLFEIERLQFADGYRDVGLWGAFSQEDGFLTPTHVAGLNYIEGTDDPDTIDGTALDDEIEGWYADDLLFGYEGDDLLKGGRGDDTLDGGSGNNILIGGYGDDSYIVSSDGHSLIIDHDALEVEFTSINLDEVRLRPTTDLYQNAPLYEAFDIGTGQLIATFVESSINSSGSTFVFDDGVAQNMWYVTFSQPTNGADYTYLSNDLNLGVEFDLLGGHDTFYGGSGSDRVIGGTGNDQINGQLGDDIAVYSGALANYTISPSGSDYTVSDNVGSEGTDTLTDIEFLEFSDGIYEIATGILTPHNANPIAQDDEFTTTQDATITGLLWADNGNGNDTDPDGDPRTYDVDDFSANGATLNSDSNGWFMYIPTPGYYGTDTFNYVVSDGNGGQDTGTVTVTVLEDTTGAPTVGRAYLYDRNIEINYIFDSVYINTDDYLKKTHAIAFETGSDVTSTQMLYEQGGGLRGLNMFIDNGNLYGAVWNLLEENWGYKELATGLEADTAYTSILVMDGELPADGYSYLYQNGVLVDSTGGVGSGIGMLYAHDNNIGIGQVQESTRVHDVTFSNPAFFDGEIEKLIHYNVALSGTDIDDLSDYLARDWLPGHFTRPTLTEEDRSIYLIDGVSETTLASSSNIDTGQNLQKTHAMAFETGSDVTTTQVLYEQGGQYRGMNLYIHNGSLYAAVWEKSTENWGYVEVSAGVTANTKYTVTFEIDSVAPSNGTAKLYLNGIEVDSDTGVGETKQQWGDIGVGQNIGITRIQDVASSDTDAFGGTIDKILQYNAILEGQDKHELEIFMSDAWLSSTHMIYGLNDDDTLNGTSTGEVIHGYFGDDILYGDDGSDVLIGGLGADTMTGGNGADTFFIGDDAIDTITDFATADGDALNIAGLLTGYDPLTDAITDFVEITDDGTDSTLKIDADGGADSFVTIATLSGVTGLTNEDALEASGSLIAVAA